jgi:hypothetical protein
VGERLSLACVLSHPLTHPPRLPSLSPPPPPLSLSACITLQPPPTQTQPGAASARNIRSEGEMYAQRTPDGAEAKQANSATTGRARARPAPLRQGCGARPPWRGIASNRAEPVHGPYTGHATGPSGARVYPAPYRSRARCARPPSVAPLPLLAGGREAGCVMSAAATAARARMCVCVCGARRFRVAAVK